MRIGELLQRLCWVSFHPDPTARGFLSELKTQEVHQVQVSVAIPDARQAEQIFGLSVTRRGIQPVFVRVVNHSASPLRLHFRSLDPRYFPALEAAARCHFSLFKRLTTFGLLAWYFLPLLLIAPFKLYAARRANHTMDCLFRDLAFPRRPISPGASAEGFVYATFDAGTKLVRVRLMAAGAESIEPSATLAMTGAALESLPDAGVQESFVDVTFSVAVPGINADYLHRRLDYLAPSETRHECNLRELIEKLRAMSTVTSNRHSTGTGDPVNLVIISDFENLLNTFAGRWDETEVISLNTCWKTARAFLLGTEYRYSPVSALFIFGRSQDIALQQIRQSISERLHLRLWLTQLTVRGKPVWVGQISRDIGVRFTTMAWNLTTHRIDPDVDEARDFLLEDLLDSQHVEAAGYVTASPACTATSPRHNLTGDPYFTDGKRLVMLLGPHPTTPRFIAWS